MDDQLEDIIKKLIPRIVNHKASLDEPGSKVIIFPFTSRCN